MPAGWHRRCCQAGGAGLSQRPLLLLPPAAGKLLPDEWDWLPFKYLVTAGVLPQRGGPVAVQRWCLAEHGPAPRVPTAHLELFDLPRQSPCCCSPLAAAVLALLANLGEPAAQIAEAVHAWLTGDAKPAAPGPAAA